MFETLKEKIGIVLCHYGWHDAKLVYEERCFPYWVCKRPHCTKYFSQKVERPTPHSLAKRVQEKLNVQDFDPNDLKMYILIRENTPADIVPLIAVHTAMGTYKKFDLWLLTQKWFETKLQKTVICKVTPRQFEIAKMHGDSFALTEVHHQELGELGLGFKVEKEYPKFFKFLPLYKVE